MFDRHSTMIHLRVCRHFPTHFAHNPTLHFIYWYATESYSNLYKHGISRKLIIKKINTRKKEEEKEAQKWMNKRDKRENKVKRLDLIGKKKRNYE